MIGRDTEVGLVERFLDGPGPSLLSLEGPAGIGKSTLWRAGIELARSRGRRVLAARGSQVETEMAYAGLQALLDGVVGEVADELSEPQRVALDVVLLRQPAPSRGLEPRAVATAALSALRALAADGPVLVAIDDVQWLDAETVRGLSFALGRLDSEDVLALVVARPGSGVSRLGFGDELARRVPVGPLAVDALRELVNDRLGDALSRPAADRLSQVTGGNPFYALELMRIAGARAIGSGPLQARDVEGLIGDQLDDLPARTRGALGVLAAVAHPTEQLVSTVLADPMVLDPAFAADVLEQDGDQLRFTHPLLAAGAYAALTPARRREVHLRLAAAVAGSEERARHLAAARGERDSDVATVVEEGGAAAAKRGAPSAAAELFEAAARLTPDDEPEQAARRWLAAAEHRYAAGESVRALELLEALAGELPQGDLRAQALSAIAWRGLIEGDRAIAIGEQAVSESRAPNMRARSLLLLSNVVMTQDEVRALGLAREALELTRGGDNPPLHAWALAIVGSREVHCHPERDGVELLRDAYAIELQAGVGAPDRYQSAGTQLGLALMLRDELDEARTLLQSQREAALAAGDEYGASGQGLHLVELECRAGRLPVAREIADASFAVLDEGVDTQPLGALLYARALVAALQGEADNARELAERGIRIGEAVGDRIFPMLNHAVLGFLELSLGNHGAALTHLEPLPEQYQRLGYREPGRALFEPDRIEALIELGHQHDATAALHDWEALGRTLRRPRVLATAARLQARSAAANGDTAAALNCLEAALAHHDHLTDPHERARTLLTYGATLRRAGRRREARVALTDAQETFKALGEGIWTERATAELKRLGGRTPAGQTLTGAEQQVANLVAEGRSNQEVADALYITVRTVEANLTRIYAKLGIRSRAQLIALHQTTAAAGEPPTTKATDD